MTGTAFLKFISRASDSSCTLSKSIANLDEIEARLERQAQSEPSASAAAQEIRAMASGGWDGVEDVNAAIREMRGSGEASA